MSNSQKNERIPMKIGLRIAQLRRQRHMTQEELASALSVSSQAVSKWEREICCPDIMLLPQLAGIFGVWIDDLFYETIVHSSA